MKNLVLLIIFALTLLVISLAEAHRSGCHRWHSCPSDSGSYICGDTGRCSACPNNQFCENGKPIVRSSEPNNNNESYEPHIKGDSLNNFTPNKVIKYREADYVDYACPKMNGVIEFSLDDGSRVDCETDTHSIEFDFGKKWAEAIGQALYYSSKTGKQPGIVLIISEKNDSNKLEKIKIVARKYGIDIKLWSIRPEALTEKN